MVKVRLIPVLYLMNGLIVRAERFTEFKIIGNPIDELARLSEWQVDELVYLDITRDGEHDQRRSDHKVRTGGDTLAILKAVAAHSFMPLTFGGRIVSLEQVDTYIRHGADKVLICSQAARDPGLVTAVARRYGSQAMMVGIDVRREAGGHAVYIDQGRTRAGDDVAGHARRMEAAGAGEILLNAIDRDGTAEGYDLDIIAQVAAAVGIPVIACGGVGAFPDFSAGVRATQGGAVAAGNIFHFTENSYRRAKQVLRRHGIDVRYPYAD